MWAKPLCHKKHDQGMMNNCQTISREYVQNAEQIFTSHLNLTPLPRELSSRNNHFMRKSRLSEDLLASTVDGEKKVVKLRSWESLELISHVCICAWIERYVDV